MSSCVLDASAVLAVLGAERGAEAVVQRLPGAVIGAVNLAEVVGKLRDRGMPASDARRALSLLALDVRPFDVEQAHAVGGLSPITRSAGLSLGDRACLALAAELDLPAVTLDGAWARVSADVEVEVVER